MRRLRVLTTTAAATGALALAGCAAPGSDAPEPFTGDVACPEVLPQPSPAEHGLGPHEPASSVPDLAAFDAAWLCTYVTADTGEPDPDGGALYGWVLADGPAEIPADRLPDVEAALEGLAVPEPMRACTSDLGPRHLLMTGSGDTTTGIAVDDYGCRDVRLTDDAWAVAPGESEDPDLVPGVLQGSGELIETLLDAAGVSRY